MTKHYDRYGRRVPSDRYDKLPSDRMAYGMSMIAVLVVAALMVWVVLARDAERKEAQKAPVIVGPTHDSLTVNYTYNGEAIRWYVMVDPDTNIQYLVNDRGGCCVREGMDED